MRRAQRNVARYAADISDAEPVDELLRRCLEPVIRDVRAASIPEPRIEDRDWTDDPESVSAMLWSADGSGTGISLSRAMPECEGVAWIADQVQDWVIEELWGAGATNWPPCPRHPDQHPLIAATSDGLAVWMCPSDTMVIGPVGSIGADGARTGRRSPNNH